MTREEAADAIAKLRTDIIFDEDEEVADIDSCLLASTAFLAACAALEQAAAHMRMAQYLEARERAGTI